jgi:hypothetical protein
MQSQHAVLQSAILRAIARVDFRWPDLSDRGWAALRGDVDEADRVEYLGDRVMYAVIADIVHERYPTASAHLYTVRPPAF